MTLLCLAPVLLSFLLLAVHFLRSGVLILMVLSLLLPLILLVRRRWATRVVQFCLVIAALEWVRTLADRVGHQIADGEPWQRMAIILLAVAVFTAASALMFYMPPLQRRYEPQQPRSAVG